ELGRPLDAGLGGSGRHQIYGLLQLADRRVHGPGAREHVGQRVIAVDDELERAQPDGHAHGVVQDLDRLLRVAAVEGALAQDLLALDLVAGLPGRARLHGEARAALGAETEPGPEAGAAHLAHGRV